MNMKQSCKALICAIEGELDGRHCTEEQAAAILDHALPSLTEALARVEAERDQWQTAYWKQHRITGEAQAQVAAAIALISEAKDELRTGPSYGWEDRLASKLGAFLAQAEQQEARNAEIARESLRPENQRIEPVEPLRVPHPLEAQGAQAGDEQEALCEAIRVSAKEFGDEADEDGLQRDARGDFVHVEVRQLLRICQLYRAALATQPAVRGAENA